MESILKFEWNPGLNYYTAITMDGERFIPANDTLYIHGGDGNLTEVIVRGQRFVPEQPAPEPEKPLEVGDEVVILKGSHEGERGEIMMYQGAGMYQVSVSVPLQVGVYAHHLRRPTKADHKGGA